MRGRLDYNGELMIERNGLPKYATCPFYRNSQGEEAHCGDWCPHFKEPYEITNISGQGTGKFVITLACVNNSIAFDERFKDERRKPQPQKRDE